MSSYMEIGTGPILRIETCSYDTSHVQYEKSQEPQTMFTEMPSALLATLAMAGIAIACGAGVALYRNYVVDGTWAAGYWWSRRDRELGPGC
jgi:hypothetical protein